MFKEKDEVKQPQHQSRTIKPATNNLEAAVERIQRKYGNDLEAFFRDAKESILKRRAERRALASCD
jgi:hypothetical protein